MMKGMMKETLKQAGPAFGIMAIVAVLLNLAMLAGGVWVIVWVLRATGVIQ